MSKIELSEDMRVYLTMLAELKECVGQLDALATKATAVVQNTKIPVKNNDVEMYNSSMIIHVSTILNNIDKLRDDIRNSAHELHNVLLPEQKPAKVIPGQKNVGESKMEVPEQTKLPFIDEENSNAD